MCLKDVLLAKARQLSDEIVDFERELIRIPSPNPPGDCEQVSKCVAAKLQEIGFEVATVHCKPEKPNVIAKLKGTVGKPALIHCAHLDTVPVGGGWTVGPYEALTREGKVFGRGAYDAKARIVVYIMAAKLIREAGFRLKGDLVGYYTVDEESGGPDGAKYCAEEGLLKGDMAICEGRQDEIWFAECGHFTLRISTSGKSAHAMYPQLGVNAIEKMTGVLVGLMKLQEELKTKTSKIPGLNYSTINVGTIQGGSKSNVLADKCSIDVDGRIIPELDVDEVIGRIQDILKALEKRESKFKAELEVVMKEYPSVSPSDTPMIGVIQKVCSQVLGFEPKAVGLQATSDGHYFREKGIPTIHWGVGRGDNRAHGADEFIWIEDLVNLTVVHALVAMELLGYEAI